MKVLDEFCEEKRCSNYKKIEGATSQGADEISLRNLRVHCERACPYSAYQFNQWLKSKGVIRLASDF